MVDAADEYTLTVTLPAPPSPPTQASAIPHYPIHVLATTAGGLQHEYDVSRRFSEFQALAMDFEELTGMATPYPLPAPPRHGTFTRFDENLAEGQRRELELFIQTLLSFITPFPAGHPVKKLVISDFLHFDKRTSAADSPHSTAGTSTGNPDERQALHGYTATAAPSAPSYTERETRRDIVGRPSEVEGSRTGFVRPLLGILADAIGLLQLRRRGCELPNESREALDRFVDVLCDDVSVERRAPPVESSSSSSSSSQNYLHGTPPGESGTFLDTLTEDNREEAPAEYRGIDPAVLETFPRWRYDEQHKQRTCAICMEEYTPACFMRTLPCLHHFHATCIDRWLLEESSECPSCKTDFGCKRAGQNPCDAKVIDT
ncbi:hypothetical protein FOZ63_018907 [Perkinsus olseni]|uniref:RING-type E3 ubiquitin transferase n=1 Tax=Perkinsus olseni TaxID=32597 RepID=A0A7J6ULT0_PEROL|nr:hypothetical protein FOZ63_018907 [Perkinsus olseni]